MHNTVFRRSQDADLPFLREMLYEAVFWRRSDTTPSFEQAMEYPEIINALESFGKREGDRAVVAAVNANPIGAAWFRYWTDNSPIRGYINENIPVIAIAVKSGYRQNGVGTKMLEYLIDCAHKNSIRTVSLAVSKDNHALHLYQKLGFREFEDKGDWFIMVRDTLMQRLMNQTVE